MRVMDDAWSGETCRHESSAFVSIGPCRARLCFSYRFPSLCGARLRPRSSGRFFWWRSSCSCGERPHSSIDMVEDGPQLMPIMQTVERPVNDSIAEIETLCAWRAFGE